VDGVQQVATKAKDVAEAGVRAVKYGKNSVQSGLTRGIGKATDVLQSINTTFDNGYSTVASKLGTLTGSLDNGLESFCNESEDLLQDLTDTYDRSVDKSEALSDDIQGRLGEMMRGLEAMGALLKNLRK